MAYRIRKNEEGVEYQDWYWSAKDVQEDVRRYRMTPEKAKKRLMEIQNLFAELLEPKLSDARRAKVVTMLHHRLNRGFNRIEHLAAISKIAHGRVHPKTLEYLADED